LYLFEESHFNNTADIGHKTEQDQLLNNLFAVGLVWCGLVVPRSSYFRKRIFFLHWNSFFDLLGAFFCCVGLSTHSVVSSF